MNDDGYGDVWYDVPTQKSEPMTGVDQATFYRYVREALGHLHDRPYLQTHPIRSSLSGSHALTVEEIHRLFIATIDQLRPLGSLPSHAPEWRHYRCLSLRYTQGIAPEKVAAELGLSARQARRLHQDALDRFAGLLWHQYGAEAAVASSHGAGRIEGPNDPRVEGIEDVTHEKLGMEAEVAWAKTQPGDGRIGLDPTLATVFQTIAPLVAQRATRISHSLPPDLPDVAIERTVLRQILLLFLTYVLQSGAGDQVNVAARLAETGDIALDFAITGVEGSSAGAANPAPAERDAGALWESATRLVRMHGGSADWSAGPDRVRWLQICLPAVRSAVVLVVDDNPGVSRLFRRYLQGTDFQILEASTATGAIALAREAQPDIVILDVILPIQDGWEVLQQLRHDEATRDIPIIVCSILPEQSLALSLGVTDFLPKPVTRSSLLAMLGRYLAVGSATSRAHL